MLAAKRLSSMAAAAAPGVTVSRVPSGWTRRAVSDVSWRKASMVGLCLRAWTADSRPANAAKILSCGNRLARRDPRAARLE